MSIRLRLVLWYGTLFTIILLIVAFVSYAFHVRGHFDEVDRDLVTDTTLGINSISKNPDEYIPHLTSPDTAIVVRLYDLNNRELASSISDDSYPRLAPQYIVDHPTQYAFSPLIRWTPNTVAPRNVSGTYGVVEVQGQRWRVYVTSFSKSGFDGYMLSITSLRDLDESVYAYGLLVTGIGAFGLIAALIGSWLIAGSALKPINVMVEGAAQIARSRDFSRRLAMPRHRDELGKLAETFNSLLKSLEAAYQAQQYFVSDASHEMRTPLTVIQANLDILKRHRDLPEEDKLEALNEADKETNRLSRLVADLLSLARADAGANLRRNTIELDTILLHAFRAAQQVGKGQKFEIENVESVQVEGDEDRVKELLVILLDNASKYTPAGGTIKVSLQKVSQSAEIKVQDTGIGIPAEDIPHIYERFYRSSGARSKDPAGSGLGLPIACWIVEQHHGAIDIQSKESVGTTVTVRLPLL